MAPGEEGEFGGALLGLFFAGALGCGEGAGAGGVFELGFDGEETLMGGAGLRDVDVAQAGWSASAGGGLDFFLEQGLVVAEGSATGSGGEGRAHGF